MKLKIKYRKFFSNKAFGFFLTLLPVNTYKQLAIRRIVGRILDMDAPQLLEQLDSAMAQLASLRNLILQMQVQLPPSIAIEAAAGICHKCKKPLGNKKAIRGCHPSCNQEMNRAKAAGEITDAQLMSMGMIGPPSPPGRKKKTSFRDLLETQANATAQADAALRLEQKTRTKKGGSKS